PEARLLLNGDEAVHVGHAVSTATPVQPGPAVVALSAALEDLDRDAVAGLHAPPLGGRRTDGLEHPDDLMAGHEGEPRGQHACVLLVIGAAEPACLYAEEAVVVADLRHGELAGDELPGRLQHQGAGVHRPNGTPDLRGADARAGGAADRPPHRRRSPPRRWGRPRTPSPPPGAKTRAGPCRWARRRG